MARASNEIAELIGCILEAMLYGIFLLLASVASFVLVGGPVYRTGSSGSKRQVHFVLLFVTISMVVLETAHMAIDISRVCVAFMDLDKAERMAYLAASTTRSYPNRNALYVTMTLLGDGVLIWRCWALWGDWRIVVLPILVAATSVVTGYTAVGLVLKGPSNPDQPGGKAFFVRNLIKLAYVVVSSSLAINVLVTLLIVGRLWWLTRQVKDSPIDTDKAIRRAMVMIIESGALNSATLMVYEIVLARRSNYNTLLSLILVPIIGISFSLVIARVGLYGWTAAAYQAHQSHIIFRGPGEFTSELEEPVFVPRHRSIRDSAELSGTGRESLELKAASRTHRRDSIQV